MSFTINGTTGINLGTEPLTGSLPDANAPVGSVIQVVSTTDTVSGEVGSTSMVDIAGLSLSITPSSASNKILLLLIGGDIITNDPNRRLYTTFVRNGTNLAPTNDYLNHYGAPSSEIIVPHAMSFLDSPATTSAITYKVQAKYAVGNVYFSNQVAVLMIAMEISA